MSKLVVRVVHPLKLESGKLIIISSNFCFMSLTLFVMLVSAMSLAILDAAQKNPGEFTHPIWSEFGITICIGSESLVFGRMYAKL